MYTSSRVACALGEAGKSETYRLQCYHGATAVAATDLITALLVAHLTVPLKLLQTFRFDSVPDRLRAEEAGLHDGVHQQNQNTGL